MKKINKNGIVLILACVIVFAGGFSLGVYRFLRSNAVQIIKGSKSFAQAIDDIDAGFSERLSYHDMLLDMYSFVLRETGINVVEKNDTTVICTKDGYLHDGGQAIQRYKISKSDAMERCRYIKQLSEVSKENGANFLYVYAPLKKQDATFPAIIKNYNHDNYMQFISAMESENIAYLDLYKAKNRDNITTQDMYFITDHHWKPEYGFWANEKICSELRLRYGFEFDEKTTDMNNYNVTRYQNWFLGSFGKKVGRYFTKLGLDDISIITPNFETDLIEEQPAKGEVKKGNYSETVMDMSQVEQRDLYSFNPYAAYTGGDFRLQIIRNTDVENGVKTVMVRDSFACTVAPFLALNCKELHTIDVRDGTRYVGEKINLKNYIEEIKPDYVIVLYSGVPSLKGGSCNFF